MRRIEATVLRTPSTESFSIVTMLAVVVGLWMQTTAYFFCVEPQVTIAFDYELQLGLVATLTLTAVAWVTLHAFRLVGAGSGAGFRLAAIGFAARTSVTLYVTMTGGETGGSIYDTMPTLFGPVWWARHLSLIAYGCGIALVAIASATDIVRRRRTSRWATLHD